MEKTAFLGSFLFLDYTLYIYVHKFVTQLQALNKICTGKEKRVIICFVEYYHGFYLALVSESAAKDGKSQEPEADLTAAVDEGNKLRDLI